MITLEQINEQAANLGLEFDEFQPYLICQSTDKDAIEAMYEWCIDNEVFAFDICKSFNEPREWELMIDPNYQQGGHVECMEVEECYADDWK